MKPLAARIAAELGDAQSETHTPGIVYGPPAVVADVGPRETCYGRAVARGADQGRTALSDDQADEVRRERARGVSRAERAARFGASVAAIPRITSGRTYATASRSTDATMKGPEGEAPCPAPAD